MNRKYFVIVIGILLIGLGAGIWQYIETFNTEGVLAVDVGTPNPGHAWTSMECSASSLCLDAANNRLGIGTNNPAQKLDVNGNIKASGDICSGSICLSQITIDGICGSANNNFYISTPTSNLCSQGTASSVSSSSGGYSWTCSGINSGKAVSCQAVGCPSGANCSVVSTEYVIQWKNVGSYNWTIPSGVSLIQYLVVAGGGSGGGWYGGGGGGGGVLQGTLDVTSGISYSLTVGAGGAGVAGDNVPGNNGGNSVFSSINAVGGGGGGGHDAASRSGSSGGGGGVPSAGTISGGTGTSGQGYNGGVGVRYGAGGGGGAGGVGETGSTDGDNYGGDGGSGYSSSITGIPLKYAGGGGGMSFVAIGEGTDGGGNGGLINDTISATAGLANTGSGGGGAGWANPSGAGGSGIVIVRFTKP